MPTQDGSWFLYSWIDVHIGSAATVPTRTIYIDRHASANKRCNPPVSIAVALPYEAGAFQTRNVRARVIQRGVCPHLDPNRIRACLDVEPVCIPLGMPGIIRFCCYAVDQAELVHAVAVEVDRRNADPPKFSKPVRIEMGIVKIAKEKVDGSAGVSPTYLIQDLLAGIRS